MKSFIRNLYERMNFTAVSNITVTSKWSNAEIAVS